MQQIPKVDIRYYCLFDYLSVAISFENLGGEWGETYHVKIVQQ